MGLGRHGRGPIGWWSPDPRGRAAAGELRVSRSLRRACARYEVRVDTAFDDVLMACADPRRPGRWITARRGAGLPEPARPRLGALGGVLAGGHLAGGLYGVAVGGLFAGESMFHRETDASKVALVALVRLLAGVREPTRSAGSSTCSGVRHI